MDNGELQSSRGSKWNKWDLHVHTPASIVHHYGNPDKDETWERYISDLESLPGEYAALGINDYWFLDGYKRLLHEQENNGRLSRFKLFPVVEFRVAKFAGIKFKNLKRPNLHIIFSNELDPDTIQSQFLNSLEQSYTLDSDGEKWEYAITRESLIELGRSIKKDVPADKLKDYRSDLVEGFNNLNINEEDVFNRLKSRSVLKDKYFTALGKTEWDQMSWSNASVATKKSIINNVDFVFTAAESVDAWAAAKKKLKENKVNHLLLDCSDAHSFSDSEDKDRIGNSLTWIKADVNFEGLRQILFEPEERLLISDEDPNNFQHAVIESFSSNTEEGEGFLLENINSLPLNSHLTCVIGPRGAGKSSLLDSIALSLGDLEVIEEDRNNYIGHFFGHQVDEWVCAKVRNSAVGELLDVSPTTADETGIDFDYYHQKRIGWLADPSQEETLSCFLFDRIFESVTDSDTLFSELQETKESSVADLRLNRGEIVNCLHEISKEHEVREKIDSQRARKQFWSQESIRQLLEQRSVIVSLGERKKRIEERLSKLDSDPVVAESKVLDSDFFENLKLSSLDPDNKVLPKSWDAIEKAAVTLTEKSASSERFLREEFDELSESISQFAKSWDIDFELSRVFEEIQEKAQDSGITVTQSNLARIDRVDKQLVTLEEQLKRIGKKRREMARLQNEREGLIDDYHTNLDKIQKQLAKQFRELLKSDGKILKETVKVEISVKTPIEECLEVIKEAIRHSGPKKPKKFPRAKALMNVFKECGLDSVVECFLNGDFSTLEGRDLGQGELEYFQQADNCVEVGMRLQELLPDLTSRLRWRPSKDVDFKSLRECSIGERGTALLSVILVTGSEPLLIDQPEDDLDHFYLAKTLTPIIKTVKKRRQLIFATHDSNIVINGDAELIIAVSLDGGLITPISSSIENIQHRETLVNILEGGKKAFKLRAKRYNLNS